MAKYCPYCGVEMSDSRDVCPLCKSNLVKNKDDILDGEEIYPKKLEIDRNDINLRKKINMRFLWLFITVFLGIALSVFLTIFFKYKNSHSWIYYPILSVAFVWLSFTNFFYLTKKPVIMALLEFAMLNIYLSSMDFINSSFVWYISLALPITLVILIFVLVFYFIAKLAKRRGWNLIGFFMIFVGIFCFSLEIIINMYLKNSEAFRWSLFVISATIPLGLLFLYMHYGLKKDIDYKRIFHT